MPVIMSRINRLWLLAAWLICLPAFAVPPQVTDFQAIPHVGSGARETYYSGFLQSDLHRAFAIAPGGAWGWASEQSNGEAALSAALEACAKHSEIPCVPYAVDDRVVFAASTWPTLWGPYKNRSDAAKVATGKKRGMRFPNLAFADALGKPLKLTDLRGKVVVLHFWGSWCPPCVRELPDLQQLVARMKGQGDIVFVLLAVRENSGDARRWLNSRKLDLPLYDNGLKGPEDENLKLADGGKIRDRELATVFPTTYVLDKHGIVVFSHSGPVENWLQYAPFLQDVVVKSGK